MKRFFIGGIALHVMTTVAFAEWIVEGDQYFIDPCSGSRVMLCQAESFGNTSPTLSAYVNTSTHKATLWMEVIANRFVVNIFWAPNEPLDRNYFDRSKRDKLVFKLNGEVFTNAVDFAYKQGGNLRTYNSVNGFNYPLKNFLKTLRDSKKPLTVDLVRSDQKTVESFQFSLVSNAEIINQFWRNIIGPNRRKDFTNLDGDPMKRPPSAKIIRFSNYSACLELSKIHCDSVTAKLVEEAKKDPELQRILNHWANNQ